ncbi:MAG: sulfur carrier protein ThiS [Clostridia bacterium]|nr:sulfur carrier protein ThiS [Clostridia bacterium]
MVVINGKNAENASGLTLAQYIENAGYNAERIVVEKNLEIICRADYDKTVISDGDSIEILNFVGGG